MKKTLQSSEYLLLHQAYKEWLQLLNYSGGTIQVLPGHLQAFLHYQEQNDKPFLTQLEATDASQFIGHLQERPVSVPVNRSVPPTSTNTYKPSTCSVVISGRLAEATGALYWSE
ncbi:hypothetical protein [Paraflavitalea speifideaquila]|uniref:hypothetical protein n=1 Tax=Paraflavitalea speifideaquila TaxID=3076558 RepID=UPI0028E2C51F|nr:hypothetical protein [Paraflavitalea speifideiaquila]